MPCRIVHSLLIVLRRYAYIVYDSNSILAVHMVTEQVVDGKKAYVCNCGLVYDDLLVAYACDEYYRTYGKLSEDITKKAVNVPHTANK